jgi:hypothetical protein
MRLTASFANALAKAQREKDAMLLCFDFASVKFAVQTCEPAETVVEAAYGTCREQERVYVDAVVKNMGISRAAVMGGLSQGKQGLRQSLLAVVLKARADSGRCVGNSN